MGANPPLEQTNSPSDPPVAFDRLFDWAIGALLTLVGLLSALVGGSLYYAIDRATVADVIASGEFRSDVLTEAQASTCSGRSASGAGSASSPPAS